jgi:uncharacterized protein (DUF697 family)
MLSPADIWRIVKDVDLEGIREASRHRVELLIASEDGRGADILGARLADGSPLMAGPDARHPWLRHVIAPAGMPALDTAPAAAVIVTARTDLAPALAALRDHLARHQVPVIAVVVGDTTRAGAARRGGEWARVAVSALDAAAAGTVARALLAAIARDRHVAAARAFPALRSTVSVGLIDETAKANAGYAFTTGLAEVVPVLSAPLAVGDMVVLTKNQLLMCYRIVLAHGRDGDPRTLLGEIVGVLGGGLLLRQAARQLVGLIPVLGIVPKVAIAYAGTWAIGRAMTLWASEGREVTAGAVRRYSREGLARGRTVARTLYERGHDRVERIASGVRPWRRRPGAPGET